jgi:SAM-dependent methyltransferase
MGTATGSPARYDEWADWYEHYITGDAQDFTERTAEILARVLGPGEGPVLDLACGTGIYGQTLSTLGWAPFGIDLSAGQLRYARTRMPVAVAEASALPVRTGTLAAVTAVLCHTDIDDYAHTCQAIGRALRAGGGRGIRPRRCPPLLRRRFRRPHQLVVADHHHSGLLGAGAAL